MCLLSSVKNIPRVHDISKGYIKANLEKIRAIFEMKSPKSIKDVQHLTSRVATLNKFICLYKFANC